VVRLAVDPRARSTAAATAALVACDLSLLMAATVPHPASGRNRVLDVTMLLK
jgi:hypothetical protein